MAQGAAPYDYRARLLPQALQRYRPASISDACFAEEDAAESDAGRHAKFVSRSRAIVFSLLQRCRIYYIY